ncbi:hypothetical protein FG386_003290 [Cryptosporidium ryanae]|uniref:uncharacterized protein n=1 Tax=Cryptosporidium ryanae TaxID=515981 RepID=UPI00351A9FBB|nr:hypothetical protein FG386_003290 [Cryptosporidium ryanae]
MSKLGLLLFFVLHQFAILRWGADCLKVKNNINERGRPLQRGRMTQKSLSPRSPSPRSVGGTRQKRTPGPKYDNYGFSSYILDKTSGSEESGGEETVGDVIKSQKIITEAPVRVKAKPIDGKLQEEEVRARVEVPQKIITGTGKISQKIRSISPRRISVVELEMGPQEMVKTLTIEAKRMEENKEGINKGSAELACGRYNFLFHCEVIEIQSAVLEKKKDKYLYTVRDMDNRNYAWNTAQGTYGRVVFGYIEVPAAGERFHTATSAFSTFYKLPDVLTGVKVLFHGGGKYPPKYLLPGMKISVAIKSYFRGIYRIARLVWNREREILYSLSKEFWTDGMGDPVTHTPTVFSVHYQNPVTKKQEVLFQDQENRKALVSELLIMERITGQTFFEVLVYLQDAKLFSWLEKTNSWELWFRAIYKLQWNLNHVLQSFMTSGYVLYMHCDLNRSNILLSIPELTFDHRRNLINITSMNTWDVRLIDLSFVWVPSALRSRNMNSICSQVNKGAIFSDANYLYVCIIELFKVPQKDLPISRPSPLYKTVRERSIKFWELLDSINEWWAVGVNFIGRNSSTHTRYKIRRPDIGGNTYNECIEGLMLMSDVYDSYAKKFGVRIPHNSFSPESYLRGYLHLSFRLSKLGLCIRTKIAENWGLLKSIVPSMSYFDFSVLTLSLDQGFRDDPESCELTLPTGGSSRYYSRTNVSKSICQAIKTCMSKIESMKSIPGDEVIKPAISVVTAENHESDRLLDELKRVYEFPESIQVIGTRLQGRFQGLSVKVDIRKEHIINLLKQFSTKSVQSGVKYPSEAHLMGLCDNLENSGGIKNVIGLENYELLLAYAKQYRLSRFCQLLFKALPNTRLFSETLNSDVNTVTETKRSETLTRLPSRRTVSQDGTTGSALRDGNGSRCARTVQFGHALMMLKGGLSDSETDGSDHEVYLLTETDDGGLRRYRKSELVRNALERDGGLRASFVRRSMELVNKVGERITRYKSILLLCSVLSGTFECRISVKERRDGRLNDLRGDEQALSTVEELTNTKFSIAGGPGGDGSEDGYYEMHWRVLSGKYGSVAFADVRIPSVNKEMFIRSHVLSSYSGTPIRTRKIRAWFHGNSAISPGWVTENINMYLAVKSPFTGVHSHGDELWERENKMNLLLSRELFSSKRADPTSDAQETPGFRGCTERYQISPAVITFHSNSDLSGNSVPRHFYLTKELRRRVKIGDQNRPIFSNYMFMEHIDGFSLEVLLYYLRSDEMSAWLGDSDDRWSLWLVSVLNLVVLVLNAVQSFSSSGYLLYMHCDLNFGNILISKRERRGDSDGDRGLLEDRNDHLTNLRRIADMSHRSVRIIDFSFSYILNSRNTDAEQRELMDFINTKGAEKVVGERNFENTCKQTLKSALFNDPNYVSIIILEIFRGYSVLFNKSRTQDERFSQVSEKWSDLGSGNRHLSVIDQIVSRLEGTREWAEIAMRFVQHEEPVKRWVTTRKRPLSSFNQGIEAYMKICDVVTHSLNSYLESEPSGQRLRDDLDSKWGKGGLSPSIRVDSCLSLETYMRGYLFLPFSFSRIGSCILDNIRAVRELRELLGLHKAYYFQLSSLTVDFILWVHTSRGGDPGGRQPTFEFYHTLKPLCVSQDHQKSSFLEDELFTSSRPRQSAEPSGYPVGFGYQVETSLEGVGNIDERLKSTVEVYKKVNKDQREFIFKSAIERKTPIPVSLLIQRAWYRLQELPELVSRKANASEVLSVLLDLFDTLLRSSKLRGYRDDKDAEYTKFLLISDKLLLDDCISASNNGSLSHISLNVLFKDTPLSDPIELCQFIIKPFSNETIIR